MSEADLTLATRDELLIELKKRHRSLLVVSTSNDKVGEGHIIDLNWFNADVTTAFGLASYAVARMGHMINCQRCLDECNDIEE